MTSHMVVLTLPPPMSQRDQDVSDLAMLVAGLKWRVGAGCDGADEYGPLSGERWHVVLRRYLDEHGTPIERRRDAAELERLAKTLDQKEAVIAGSQNRWADILRRYLGDNYTTAGRPNQQIRDQLLARHYWLFRRVYSGLNEDECADQVARVYADAGGNLTGGRIKRIAKTANRKRATLQWIDEQVGALTDHAPDIVVRALLATFEPRTDDAKLLNDISNANTKVK